jgi:hypothetical protein
LIDVYSNVNTERNIFYSAYMKGKIQYNDVDPDKVLKDKVLNIENGNVKQVNNDYVTVPDINLPIKADVDEDDSKIIVTNHDISNPSSSENLQNLETQV